MLFADSTLARRIETAECRLTTDAAAAIARRLGSDRVFVAPLAGGAAVHVGEEAPFNKLIGLGVNGPVDQQAELALEIVEREFDARGARLQAEVATLADHSFVSLLSRRGYVLVGFENVLGISLDAALLQHNTGHALPPSLRLETAGHPELSAWIDTMVSGFAYPDAVPGGEPHESFPLEPLKRVMVDMASLSGLVRYLARWDGVLAGAGGIRLNDGIAQLCGSATLPALRRRGVQSALLLGRLVDAARAGGDLAVVTTQPGSRSQLNAQRQGFVLLYARAILVREPR